MRPNQTIAVTLLTCIFCLPPAAGQTVPETSAAEQADQPLDAANAPAPEPESTARQPDRTDLNLLGQTNVEAGESRRNENVQINLIDNNVLRELNKRVGVTATAVDTFEAERNYYGAEYGGSPTTPLHLAPSSPTQFHGELWEAHNNSIFTARSFFQVGDVLPARENDYGARLTFPLWKGGHFQLDGSQQRIRGSVNGNVLVPRPDERTPLTTNPQERAFIESILAAYPDELPNRTDINERALNTNSRQSIDNDSVGARLDQQLGSDDKLVLDYRFTVQKVDAFQLVGGQNPNTTTRSHSPRITWNRAWTQSTITDFSATFDRVSSVLVTDDSFPGVGVSTGDAFELVGGTNTVPIDRAQNEFQYAGRLQHITGRHTISAGFELTRRQINGFESNSHLGHFIFSNDFGRSAIDNFLLGTASEYIQSIGNVHRGYRNWDMQYFVGDVWRVSSDWTLNFGLRYQPSTSPFEVDGIETIGYDCDCNNLAPTFGFARRLSNRWGVLRAAYGIHYGSIVPVTYGQARYNAPSNLRLTVLAPDLLNPLGDINPESFDPTTPSAVFELDKELASPYSHQYNFSWELPLRNDWSLEMAYIGSRTHKIVSLWNLNRGRPADGIPQVTATVNERRPDLSTLDVRYFLNGSRAYYDAAKLVVNIPRWHGWTMDASYWFSKAIDLGAAYTSTGTGRDGFDSRGQSEFNVQQDMKSLSSFDQPHAFLWSMTYETPALRSSGKWARAAFGGWQISSVALFKKGTPFALRTGSDSPGFGNVDGASSDRPNILDPSILGRTIGHPDTSRQLLPVSAFGFIQPTERRGNLGYNTFRKDGISNINAAISRNWPLGSDRTLTLRAESVNLFNTPQFAEPGRAVTSPDFGQITNTLNDGRAFRFLLRLAF
ncbi:MAG: TonB-dependent receptor [Acidobacteria bacterium]|nr:TonB-dependent receptor [Acidobacteriota bacterium]